MIDDADHRVFIETLRDYALVMVDPAGRILSWNKGAEATIGFRGAEVLGRNHAVLYLPEQIARGMPANELDTAARDGHFESEDWRARKDGSTFWANVLVTAIRDRGGTLLGFSMGMRDLTERRRHEEQLRASLSQRRHAESLADTAEHMHEFIAMLAHELRNPLAPIRTAVCLLGRPGLTGPMAESMRQTIDRQTRNLTRIVDELLDVNRVASGHFTIHQQLLDLREVVAHAVETSRPLIDQHGHRLHLEVDGEPIDCSGDLLRLSQAVVNILDNAAKFTPDGGDIWLTATRTGRRAELRIRDNGRGIGRDSIDRVFDLFVQVDAEVGSALGGLGVGLALVRRIVELHAGSIQAVSDGPGKGSEFILRLPLARATASPSQVG